MRTRQERLMVLCDKMRRYNSFCECKIPKGYTTKNYSCQTKKWIEDTTLMFH
uniref:Uncharacterized protein n=1 Tax=Arion vulgaris TaxID=1028688 RepID=A0A0B7C1D2_9EUPU